MAGHQLQGQDSCPTTERIVFFRINWGPASDFGGGLFEGQAQNTRRLQLLCVRRTNIRCASGYYVIHERIERQPLFLRVGYFLRDAENDSRAIVHGVMEGRPGENQTVEQRHCDAHWDSLLHVFQHPAANGAMDIQMVVYARVSCGDNVRLCLNVEPHVADQGFIDDGVDGVAIVATSVALAGNGGAGGLGQDTLL